MPGSIESRKGLFREKVADSFKKICNYWFKTEPLPPPIGTIYPAIFSSTKKLFFTRYTLFVPRLTTQIPDENYNYLVVGFREKSKYFPESDNIKVVGWRITHPGDVNVNGCNLDISRRFVRKNKYIIDDGKHEFIVYFVYD